MHISDWSSDVCSSDLLSGMAIDWQWLPKGWLLTCQIRPVIHVHPGTGDELWFNHIAFWHSSSLEESVRARFEADFGVENLPYNTYYGDGAMIPDEIVRHLRGAYDEETVRFCWQSEIGSASCRKRVCQCV